MAMTKISALLAAIGIAVAVTACGSSGGSNAASSTPATEGGSSSSGNTATGEPIKIGMINPANAPFYNAPDELAAIKAAIASINADGGVKGRPLQLDWCNEGNDANKATACARKMISDGVVATVDSISPVAGTQMSEALAKGPIANVNYGALTSEEFATKSNFPFDGAAAFENAGVVGLAMKTQGVKKVLIVRNDNPQPIPIETLVKQVTEKNGGTFAGHVLLPLTAIPDYSSYAQQIIKSGADLVDFPLGKANAIGIVNAVRQLGSNVKFAINCGAFSDADLKSLGSNIDGLLIGCSNPWVHDAGDYSGINDFLTSMKAEQDRGDKEADVTTGRPFMIKDWASMYSLRAVLTQLATANTPITAASVLAAFSKATDLPLANTMAGTWSPSKLQTAVPGFANVANTEAYILKVSNGQQALLQKDPVDVLSYLQ